LASRVRFSAVGYLDGDFAGAEGVGFVPPLERFVIEQRLQSAESSVGASSAAPTSTMVFTL
jgi:hypothetical protein